MGENDKDLRLSPEIMKHYEFLQDIGVFNIIHTYSKRLSSLSDLMEQASIIFTLYSCDEIIDYVVKCLSERYIPSDLIIILNSVDQESLPVKSFKNMKPIETPFSIDSLQPFSNYFDRNPGTVSFHTVEHEFEEWWRSLDFRPEILVPIPGISGLSGLILFGPKLLEKEYVTEEIEFLDRLMQFISIALQNYSFYSHSIIDPKTGVSNRRHFLKRLEEEMAKSRRYGWMFSLLILNIDHFKICNDTYGYSAGDRVLVEMASCIRKNLREEDLFARTGGEEFSILLAGSGPETCWKTAERIRREIEKLSTVYQEEEVRVTVSLGGSCSRGHTKENTQELIQLAEKALAQSKEEGRNKTTILHTGLLFKAEKKKDGLFRGMKLRDFPARFRSPIFQFFCPPEEIPLSV